MKIDLLAQNITSAHFPGKPQAAVCSEIKMSP
jgi:hypothetical protein